ncbi:MAG: hypothetical protein QG573_2081, partial [Acidobacteriota bacterium]|nr:hypothetical protein [Acidobacteriota bacterium]
MRSHSSRVFIGNFAVLGVIGAIGILTATVLMAATPAQEIARLGADLTPLGGEKAANKDGSIPAWEGGLTAAPAGYVAGKHYVDPFAAEKPVVTINAGNMAQYAGKLS